MRLFNVSHRKKNEHVVLNVEMFYSAYITINVKLASISMKSNKSQGTVWINDVPIHWQLSMAKRNKDLTPLETNWSLFQYKDVVLPV